MKVFSRLKQRIRQFCENQSIDLKIVYQKTGISDGSLSNKSSLNEDGLLKFFSCYPEISAEWLLSGEGSMLRIGTANRDAEPMGSKVISLLEKDNARLELENKLLKEKLANLEQSLFQSPPKLKRKGAGMQKVPAAE